MGLRCLALHHLLGVLKKIRSIVERNKRWGGNLRDYTCGSYRADGHRRRGGPEGAWTSRGREAEKKWRF